MPGPHVDDESKDEKLKSALWYGIGKTIDSLACEQDFNATPHFIGGLSELVWAQIQNAANDLEAFAKHGGRTTINAKDVVLLARRNEGLEDVLKTEAKRVTEKDTR
ncbi:putative apoptosis-inducing TAF9-like domain 1 family protein [Teratosphaeria destructans]|uniref:Apoptosis-inducing TAF9-like domain 1 family protein n=1 Tax=Teratosphaeria destructans TaxID=418781 RepID=A0A9W7SL58_9PEZI|nr:putative apoptosis-inducing TAF9-like domain 1 family protein [Teratosphaeria destructans]